MEELEGFTWDVASPDELAELEASGVDLSKFDINPLHRTGWKPVTEEDEAATWADYGNAMAGAAADMGAGLAALSEWSGVIPGAADARKAFSDIADEQYDQITPVGKRQLSAEFLPSEGEDSVLDAGLTGSLGIKSAAMLPSLIVSLIPAGIAGRIAAGAGASMAGAGMTGAAVGRVTAGALNAGATVDQIFSAIDELSDEDLMESDVYAGYLAMGMSPAEARDKLKNDIVGVSPYIVGALSAVVGGLEGQLGSRVAGGAASGLMAGARRGLVGEGTQEGFEGVSQEFATQAGLADQNLGEMDWTQIWSTAIESVVLGGGVGATLGGLGNIGGGAEPARREIEQVQAGAPDASQTAALNAGAPAATPQPAPSPAQPQPAAGLPPVAAAPAPTAPVQAGPAAPAAAPAAPAAAAPPVATQGVTAQPSPTMERAQAALPEGTQAVVDANGIGSLIRQPEQAPAVNTPENVDPVTGDPAAGTQPEPLETLIAQMKDLVDGIRQAVLVPKGAGLTKIPAPEGMKRVAIKDQGTVFYDPKQLKAKDVMAAASAGRLNDILNMGPTTKAEALTDIANGAEEMAAVVRGPDGVPKVEAVTSSATVEADASAMAGKAAPGDTLEITTPEAVVDERQERLANERLLSGMSAPLEKNPPLIPSTDQEVTQQGTQEVAGPKGPRILKTVAAQRAEAKAREDYAALMTKKDADAARGQTREIVAEDVGNKDSRAAFERRAAAAVKKDGDKADPALVRAVKLREKIKAANATKGKRHPLVAEIDRAMADYASREAERAPVPVLTQPKRDKNAADKGRQVAKQVREARAARRSANDEKLITKLGLEGRPDAEVDEILRLYNAQRGEAKADKTGVDISARGSGSKEGADDGRDLSLQRSDDGTDVMETYDAKTDEATLLDEAPTATASDAEIATAVEEDREFAPVVNERPTIAVAPDAISAGVDRAGTFQVAKPRRRITKRPLYLQGNGIVTEAGDRVAFEQTTDFESAVRKALANAGGAQRVFSDFIVKRILTKLGPVKLHVVTPEGMARLAAGDPDFESGIPAAFYSAATRSIVIDATYANNLHVLMHEGTHAAFDAVLETDIVTQALVGAMMNDLAERLPGHYALTDIWEFTAEAFSNPDLQEELSRMPASDGIIRMAGLDKGWKSIWAVFVSAVRRALGVPRNAVTLLDAVVRMGQTLNDLRIAANGEPAGTPVLTAKRPLPRSAVLERGGDFARGQSLDWRRRTMKVMTLDQIRQQFSSVFQSGALDRVVAGIQKITPYANKKREAAEVLAQRYIDWSKTNPAAAERFGELAVEATMLNVNVVEGVDPADIVAHPSNAHLGKDATAGWQAKGRLPAIQRQFMALPPEARALWRDMTTYYRDTQNEITRTLISNILDAIGSPMNAKQRAYFTQKVMDGELDENLHKPMVGATIFKALNEAKEVRAIKGVYFPLMRQGNYVVQTKDRPGNLMGGTLKPGTDNVVVFRAKSDKDARKLARAFAQRTGDVPSVVRVRKEPDSTTSFDHAYEVTLQLDGVHFFDTAAEAEAFRRTEGPGYARVSEVMDKARTAHGSPDLSTSALASIINSINQRHTGDENAGLRSMMTTALTQASVRLMTGNRVQQRSLTRRNVQGASTNLEVNTLQYGEAASRYLAKIQYMPAVRDAMMQLRADQKASKFDMNAGARSQVLNEIVERVEKNVVAIDEPSGFVHNLLALSFLDKLFSPAYSFINSLQPGMVTLPILSGRFGLLASSRELTAAYRTIGAGGSIMQGVRNTGRAAKDFARAAIMNRESVVEAVKAKVRGDRELSSMIDMLVERGMIDPNVGFELAQAVSTRQGNVGNTIARMDRIARQLPIAVEVVNRSVSAIAAYKLARQNGMSAEAAQQFAFDTVANTQGDYSAANAPAIFNHPVGRIALQFRKYAQMMYYLLGDAMHRAFKGTSREERMVARKQLAYIVGTQVMMAGTLGIPGLEIVKFGFMAAAALGLGEGYEEFEREVRASMSEMFGVEAAELLARGVIPRAFGIDISSRVGMDSLLTFGEPRSYEKDGPLAWVATTIAGAPAGLVFDQFKAARSFADVATGKADSAEFWKGFERLPLPKFVADSIKAGRKVVYGDVSGTTGKQTFEPIDLVTAGVNAFGLRTAKQAEKQEAMSAQYGARGDVTAQNYAINRLKNEFAQAKNEGERVRVLAKMRTLNEDLPTDRRVSANDLRKFARNYRKSEQKGLVRGPFRVANEREARQLDDAAAPYNVD